MQELEQTQENLKRAMIELEEQFVRDRDQIIEDGENELDNLRRQIEEYEQIIREEEERLAAEKELNAEEIERQCDELFAEAPIKFRPQKDNELDGRLAELIAQEDIRIPIVFIKDNLYLIGSQKCTCYLRQGNVIVRVGGGQHNFEEYVPFNHRIFERILVINMINSNQSLEWVLEQLIQNNRIKATTYPLNRTTTGVISSPEREKGSPRRDGSPSRFTERSPARSPKSRVSTTSPGNSPMTGSKRKSMA